ncbi:MAG: cysteine hydrolase family protein [Desulfovibrio sp.]|uniref:cysteine hydrolase family protein n=1 Tax=Desulfovibrio sp. 7SRBS1 TaxID=3378064 RepID=UPI003B425A99
MSENNFLPCVEQDDPHTVPDAKHIALVSIDLQNDFCSVSPETSGGEGDSVVEHSIRLTRGFRAAGLLITHVVRLYLPDGSNVDPVRREAVRQGMQKVIVGTDGAASVPGLLPPGSSVREDDLLAGNPCQVGANEFVVYKPRWGAFYRTCLEDVLAGHEINTLVICGTVFPNCVRATIHQALERDFRVVLACDAIAGIYSRGVQEYIGMGASALSVDEILKRFC